MEILEAGEPAPFGGVLMTNRLFMELFDERSTELLTGGEDD